MYWKYTHHNVILYACSRVSNNYSATALSQRSATCQRHNNIMSPPPRTFSSHDGYNNIIYIGNVNRVNDSNNNNRDIVKKK